jgi:predicted Zn-dependent protease with MMP-like domain
MIDLEDFRQIVADELDLLPEVFFKDLNGGIIVQENVYLHPDRVADDLYIMGTYSLNASGRQITLYYGSFAHTMGNADREQIRTKVREVLRHEFRHHMEFLSGISGKKSLVAEDERSLHDYFAMRRK